MCEGVCVYLSLFPDKMVEEADEDKLEPFSQSGELPSHGDHFGSELSV